jgi:hypothetical protein
MKRLVLFMDILLDHSILPCHERSFSKCASIRLCFNRCSSTQNRVVERGISGSHGHAEDRKPLDSCPTFPASPFDNVTSQLNWTYLYYIYLLIFIAI